MQFIDKLLNTITNKKKKHQQAKSEQDTGSNSVSSTSTLSFKNKRFSSLRKLTTLRHKERKTPTVMNTFNMEPAKDIHQELLLTQCIETALYLPKSTRTDDQVNLRNTSRNHINDYHRRTISFSGEYRLNTNDKRSRKLSLPPPQLNHGCLESIPEVDSQILLNFNNAQKHN